MPPMPSSVNPRPQRNRPEVLGGDEDDQRVAAAAVGHPRRDQAERLERHLLAKRELHRAGVQAARLVAIQEPAAGHDAAGVDRQPDAGRRLEPGREVERSRAWRRRGESPAAALTPTRSITARTGPKLARRVAETSAATRQLPAIRRRCADGTVTGPSDRFTGIVASRSARASSADCIDCAVRAAEVDALLRGHADRDAGVELDAVRPAARWTGIRRRPPDPA